MKNSTSQVRKKVFLWLLLFMPFLQSIAQQIPNSLTAANGTFIGFYEYKPVNYNPTGPKYPIIIFMHGIGERGNGTTELSRVSGVAIPRYIRDGNPMTFTWNGKTETFLVLSPQLSSSWGYWPSFYPEEMIKYAKANLNIDTNRIIVTGLSLGGGGVWQYASTSLANSKAVAAIAPVCGTCTMVSACNISQANVPIWAFHAQDDGTVGVGCTTGQASQVTTCGTAIKPLMTIYPNGGHGIWDRAYDVDYNWQNPNIFEWFLGQNKSLAPNVLPVARAGSDFSILLPTTTATLNGTASSDADGNIAKYFWRQLSGPVTSSITSINGATTQVTGLTSVGVYSFELKVADNRVSVKTDTINVTVNMPAAGLPPVANAGTDITISLPTNTANLSGMTSSDADGSISTYSWTKFSGPAGGALTTPNNGTSPVTSLVAGSYGYRLVVTDNSGLSDDDTVFVTVNATAPPPNQVPIARAGSDITITLPTNSTNLSGMTSSDPDGTISSYSWSKVSGPAGGTLVTPNNGTSPVSGLIQGTYSYRLAVTDNGGAIDDDTILVIVNAAAPPPNQAPTANAGGDINITLPTNSTTLNGSGSSDPDGTISTYSWTKVSGPAAGTIVSAGSASSSLTGLIQGTYSYRLQVTDNGGLSSSDTVTVTVNAAPPPPNQAPIANAGSDINITLPTNSTTLNGTGSSDPDGTISTYSWTKVSGPAAGTIVSAGNASSSLTGLIQGTYSYRLQVTDNGGLSSSDTVTVTVNAAPPPPNQAPVANAGSDITISLPTNSTTLNGSGSSDPDGTISTYSWTKISGPAAGTIANAGNASTALTGLIQGTYSYRLQVTDNGGLSSSDTVTVTVNSAPPPPNQAPVANAGGNISITLPTNSTTLNGSGSSDADGTITTYSWSKVSGPAAGTIANAGSASTALTGLVQGSYSFRLQVTDNGGLTNADTVTVTVNAAAPPPNQAPIANAGGNISITLPTNSTTLNGSGSSDPDGTISTYSWTKISGPAAGTIANAGSASTALTGLVQGSYNFRLQVTDNGGLSDADTVTVTVNAAAPPPNQAPIANAGGDINITLPTNSTTLNGSGSSDPDGTISTYSWTKISGPAAGTIVSAGSASSSLTGLVQGTFSYRLQVTDNGGLSSSDTVVVIVNAAPPPPNQAPVANAGQDLSVTLPNSTISLNGSASYDPDGTIATYDWVKISGPGAITLTNSNTATPGVTGVQAGVYVFELTVTDDKGATAKDQVQLTVNAANNAIPVANAGRDTTIGLPVTSVVLNASASYDPDGSIASYSWKQVSGPTNAVIVNTQSAVSTVNGLTAGTYIFEITVTDNKGASQKASVSVNVVNNLRYVESLKVYPNPARDNINIRVISDSTGVALVNIYDVNGKVVKRAQYTKGQPYFESPAYIQNLKNGIYYVEVIIGTRKKMITKFIKQ